MLISRAMLIIGCDFHTRYQQIAMSEDSTGELLVERRLEHESGEGGCAKDGALLPFISSDPGDISEFSGKSSSGHTVNLTP